MEGAPSKCSSGCASGWTAYLAQSCEKTATPPTKGEAPEEEEEEESLSMVSDASSGPAHVHVDHYYCHYHHCHDHCCFSSASSPSSTTAALLNKAGKRRRVEKEQHRQQEEASALLDDTASSPFFGVSKKSFDASHGDVYSSSGSTNRASVEVGSELSCSHVASLRPILRMWEDDSASSSTSF